MVSEVQKIVFVVMTPQVLVLSAGRSMFERIISADKIKNKGLLWDSDEKKKNKNHSGALPWKLLLGKKKHLVQRSSVDQRRDTSYQEITQG